MDSKITQTMMSPIVAVVVTATFFVARELELLTKDQALICEERRLKLILMFEKEIVVL